MHYIKDSGVMEKSQVISHLNFLMAKVHEVDAILQETPM